MAELKVHPEVTPAKHKAKQKLKYVRTAASCVWLLFIVDCKRL
jgi:hypothetical protein